MSSLRITKTLFGLGICAVLSINLKFMFLTRSINDKNMASEFSGTFWMLPELQLSMKKLKFWKKKRNSMLHLLQEPSLHTLCRFFFFLPFFIKGDNYCDFHLALLHKNPPEKGSTLKGKNLLPLGANSFLLEWTLFQKGDKTILAELPPLKVYPFPLNIQTAMYGQNSVDTNATASVGKEFHCLNIYTLYELGSLSSSSSSVITSLRNWVFSQCLWDKSRYSIYKLKSSY